MDSLKTKYLRLLSTFDYSFKRYLYHQINWDDRLIVIKGQRGVGKTTMLLQRIKEQHYQSTEAIYLSLDDMYFSNHRLTDVVEEFVLNGGKALFLDEVHRYPDWSIEIKNIYDFYPDLTIVATGSSAIAIREAEADLSRRASVYHLHTLSMREYLALSKGFWIDPIPLKELLHQHEQIAMEMNGVIKPIPLFQEFLQIGSYPFSHPEDILFHDKLTSMIHLVIDHDIPAIENISYETRLKIKKLLQLLSTSVPYKPNITELSQKVGTSRDILLKYLHLCSQAGILRLLTQSETGNSILQKPEKIYMQNPNLMIALDNRAEIGNLRETFFLNQVSVKYSAHYPKSGDFFVDNTYTFEIGGTQKNRKQIQDIPNAFTALDNLEYGHHTKIPLWMFGFLY